MTLFKFSFRGAHLPNVHYVSPELTFYDMWLMYKDSEAYQTNQCEYDTYRKHCKTLNIFTAGLGNEDCLTCEEGMYLPFN